MNGMRKLVFFLTAMVLAAFALPAAAQKVYTLNLAPTSLNAGSSGVALSATMNNISPDNGNSSVKSFKLFAPTGGGITIASPASGNNVPLGGGYTATIQNNGSSIYVSNIQLPLKPFGPGLVLNMTVNVACTATGGSWTTFQNGVFQVWNGSGFTGQTFTQQNPSFLAPTINTGCAFYTFATSPASVNSPSDTITATLKNTSASANLNSAKVTAPTGIAITGGTASNGGSVSVSGQVVTVQGGAAVAPGGSLVLTLTATTTPSCTAAAAAAWSNAHAYSGSSLNGTELTLQTSPYPTTGITAQACGMSIVPPSSAVAGSQFNVVVNLISGPGGANITLTSNCGFTGAGTVAATGSSATFSGTVANPGTCTFNASADKGYPSAPPFTGFTVYGGQIGCASTNNFGGDPALDPDLDGPFVGSPGYGLRRGPNLDDLTGANCVLVNYNFTFDPNNNFASLLYDKAAGPPQQKAQFEYVLLWNAVPIEASGYPTARPMVSWGIANPSYPADYVPALACVDDDYVGLGSAVMPAIPAAPPFNNGTYPAGTYPQYQPGQPAKMCVAQEGWTSVGGGLLQHWSKIIDQSDGYIRLP